MQARLRLQRFEDFKGTGTLLRKGPSRAKEGGRRCNRRR